MATYSNLKFITGVAGENLRDKQSRLVKFDGTSFTTCGEGDPAFGAVFAGSNSGGHTTVTYRGNMVVEAGGTFSAGDNLQSDSQGRVIAHTGSNPIVGVALSDAVVGQKVQVQFIGLSGNGGTSSPETVTRIALWGQSEIQKLNELFDNGADTVALTAGAEGKVTIVYWNRDANIGPTGVVRQDVVDGSTTNTRHIAIANSLYEADPARSWVIAMQAQSGTDFPERFADNFRWNEDVAVHNAAFGGVDPDIVAMDWYAAPQSLGLNYAPAVHELTFGRTIAGASIGTLPTTITGGDTIAHTLAELYDWSVTKFVVLEPHRFEANQQAIADNRTSVRSMYTNSTETALVGPGHPVLHYQNQTGDLAHPASGEGSRRFGVGLVQSTIRALGITSWNYPVIDNAYWAPDGTYVDIWSSAGPIVVGTTPPVGTWLNGARVTPTIANDGGPAGNVSGVLRITAPVGTPFQSSTVIDFTPFSTGLASGADTSIGWDQYPLVDVNAPGMPDGVPLANKPDPAILASTIAGVTPWAITGDDGLQGQATVFGSTQTAHVWRWRANLDTPGTTRNVFKLNNGGINLQALNNGTMRFSGPGVSLTTLPGWTPGVMQDFQISYDPANGEMRLWIDGTLQASGSTTAWTNGAYPVRMLNDFDGDWNNGLIGSVEYIKVWVGTTASSGDELAGTPTYELSGDQASVVSQANAINAVEQTFAVIIDGSNATPV